MSGPVYVYAWGNNAKRKILKGRTCTIEARMKKGSVVARFLDDGELEVVSRRALRKVKDAALWKGSAGSLALADAERGSGEG